ncbi:hypothetical protein H4R18_001533 [Coemansia javaensis]|uniref:Uncharacterized protein n=1 Tax=Coemansia javaensis TaxID=2761396 RepID=A0A9W8LK60_9FUNG|nr:hypothetical protein H4R18_001533 [Coemansia javaensis]
MFDMPPPPPQQQQQQPEGHKFELPDLAKEAPLGAGRMFAPQFFGMPFLGRPMPFAEPRGAGQGLMADAEHGMPNASGAAEQGFEGAEQNPSKMLHVAPAESEPGFTGEDVQEGDKKSLSRRWHPYGGGYGYGGAMYPYGGLYGGGMYPYGGFYGGGMYPYGGLYGGGLSLELGLGVRL